MRGLRFWHRALSATPPNDDENKDDNNDDEDKRQDYTNENTIITFRSGWFGGVYRGGGHKGVDSVCHFAVGKLGHVFQRAHHHIVYLVLSSRL